MAPRMHDPDTRRNLTGNYLTILSYHPVTTRQTREHGAWFCLGESLEYKHFDLCYSFKTLVHAEYGSLQNLHEVAWNYRNNQAKVFGTGLDVRMSYDKALRKPHCFYVWLVYRHLWELWGPERPPGHPGSGMPHSCWWVRQVSSVVQEGRPLEAPGSWRPGGKSCHRSRKMTVVTLTIRC